MPSIPFADTCTYVAKLWLASQLIAMIITVYHIGFAVNREILLSDASVFLFVFCSHLYQVRVGRVGVIDLVYTQSSRWLGVCVCVFFCFVCFHSQDFAPRFDSNRFCSFKIISVVWFINLVWVYIFMWFECTFFLMWEIGPFIVDKSSMYAVEYQIKTSPCCPSALIVVLVVLMVVHQFL